MNRNVESHFSQNPTNIDLQRSQFDRSSTVKLSFNTGELVPFFVDEVLPGDTFKVTSSKVVRLQTMLKPIMDNMYLDTYYFFVPNRLVWDHWKEFCGESDQAWLPSVEYSVPKLKTPASGFEIGSLADYMGVSPLVKNYEINALPFRMYAKIVDDWFLDENLTDRPVISIGDATTEGNSKSASDLYCSLGGPLFHVAKYHDYFTSCLPAPQKGPSVTLPTGIETLNRYAPVITGAPHSMPNDSYDVFRLYNPNSSAWTSGNYWLTKSSAATALAGENPSTTAQIAQTTNHYADLQGAFGPVAAVSISDLRLAFTIQRFYEKCARGGTRYIEVLKSQFGVTSPDARLQRSEYLGGNRIPLNVHEITNNSESETAFLGNLGAMSHTSDVNSDFIKSFTEHGFVIGVCCVRYDHTYGQGLERFWTRSTKFDYYWPVFANIGEQPVYKREIYFDSDHADEVFGYQEAWADYRYKPSRVAGEMRPEAPATLASWHLADDYASVPSLSDEWIREDKTNVDRCLAVSSSVSNQIFADFYIQNICSRAMPLYSIPGLIDHN